MSSTLSEIMTSTLKNEENYKQLMNILSKIIGDTVEKSVKYEQKLLKLEGNKNESKISFNSKEIPKITITNYIKRLIKYTKIEPSTLILGIIYFDRICSQGNIILSFFNVYKLLLISFILAIKYNEEYFETNEFYAKIGGLNIKSINKLEVKVLKIINFNLYVNQDIYDNYVNQFEAFIQKKTNFLM